MAKAFKWLVILGFVFGLALAFSYLGARASVGKLIGSAQTGERTIRFLWGGAPTIPGRPRVWQFSFSRVADYENQRAVVYVSPTGAIVRTVPADLAEKLEAAVRAKDTP
jgi:hypothetical protein